MEPALSLTPSGRPWARIALARVLQLVGWAGVAGLALLLAALALSFKAASARAVTVELLAADAARAPLASSPLRDDTRVAAAKPALRLMRRDDVPVLLTRIERAATESGLPWSAADYRVSSSTEREPAMLEVRCAFKAPYPKVRAMVAQVLDTVPGTTFRDIAFSRATVDAADVDAKLSIAVYLVDDGFAPPPVRGQR